MIHAYDAIKKQEQDLQGEKGDASRRQSLASTMRVLDSAAAVEGRLREMEQRLENSMHDARVRTRELEKRLGAKGRQLDLRTQQADHMRELLSEAERCLLEVVSSGLLSDEMGVADNGTCTAWDPHAEAITQARIARESLMQSTTLVGSSDDPEVEMMSLVLPPALSASAGLDVMPSVATKRSPRPSIDILRQKSENTLV